MPKKILIADDEPNIIKMVESRLQSQGYIVIAARDGEQALEKAKSEKPDLIILDVMMPKLDGNEVCRRLRASAECKNIPIVMLTACGQAADIKKGMEGGADSYVSKPFKSATLLGIVSALAGPNE